MTDRDQAAPRSPIEVAFTAILVAAGAWLAFRVGRWALVDATWSGDGIEACRARGGACWAFVRDKARLILFGTYPYDQQWRAALASLVVVGLFAATGLPRLRRPGLAWAWAGSAAVVVALMRGGFLGLTHVETARWGGLPLTLLLATVGIVAAFPIGVLLALARWSRWPVPRALATAYVETIRGVPLVTMLFMASVMLPLFLPRGWDLDKLVRAQIAIVLFVAAYLCEVVRGGLNAIPRGQLEAARSLGLGAAQAMRFVVLPQALRAVVPPLVNTAIGLFKDTSLVVVIGLLDLTNAAKLAMSDPAWLGAFAEGYLFIGAIYLAFCLALSRLSRSFELEPLA
jgi:general L-amino acid transport system permease protein